MSARAVTLLGLAGALAGLSCAHVPPAVTLDARPASVDSVTVALWRMDESATTLVADAGSRHLDGTAGPDSRTAFGRFGGGRVFVRSIQSFVVVPYAPVFDVYDGLTVEAWVKPESFTTIGDQPIAARWTPEANMQSWIFSIIGRGRQPYIVPRAALAAPRFALPGQLAFAMLPADAGEPQVYVSTQTIQIGRWTHVAVTYDGDVVQFWLDGRLDSQYALPGRIRASQAPLLIGNWFDPRALTDFEGRLRVTGGGPGEPSNAFDGTLDELRISRFARTSFPELGVR